MLVLAPIAIILLFFSVLTIEVTVPEGMMGDAMSDLTGRRGRIVGTVNAGDGKVMLRATVPQAEMLRYAIDLRSFTRGYGTFTSRVISYEEVPAHLAAGIIANHKKEREAEHGHH